MQGSLPSALPLAADFAADSIAAGAAAHAALAAAALAAGALALAVAAFPRMRVPGYVDVDVHERERGRRQVRDNAARLSGYRL